MKCIPYYPPHVEFLLTGNPVKSAEPIFPWETEKIAEAGEPNYSDDLSVLTCNFTSANLCGHQVTSNDTQAVVRVNLEEGKYFDLSHACISVMLEIQPDHAGGVGMSLYLRQICCIPKGSSFYIALSILDRITTLSYL